jgi:hypothetical protein
MTLSPKIDDDCGRPAKPHVAKPTLCAATVGCHCPLSPRARYSMPLRDMATDSCRRYTSVCAVPECISSHPIPSHLIPPWRVVPDPAHMSFARSHACIDGDMAMTGKHQHASWFVHQV